MGSVLGAWQLVYIGAAIPLGVALDRIGPRWALLAATLIGVIFDATGGFSPSLAVLTVIMVMLVFLLLRLQSVAPAST